MLIGGYAVNYYGYPRATADIDIWISRSDANCEKAAAAVREFGFWQAEPSLFAEPGNVIRMGVPPFRIEVLNSISGVNFEECFARATLVDIDGVQVTLISPGDLKANKKASGRPKDLADIDELP
jgi:hypothetical protein